MSAAKHAGAGLAEAGGLRRILWRKVGALVYYRNRHIASGTTAIRRWHCAAPVMKSRGEMMSKDNPEPLAKLLGLLFKAHPWHGVSIGDDAPEVVMAYIEIVPTDTVKYEMDKLTGILKIDRPQRFSNVCPAPYGLVPQTYCGERVADLFSKRSGRLGIRGDGDPLDICVLTEKDISHSDILLKAAPIGGLSMIDGDDADDKIIAVMCDDVAYGGWQDINDCPRAVIDRLQHYFLTYKNAPGSLKNKTEITQIYGREEALNVIRASHEDYLRRFPDIEGRLLATWRGIA